MLILPKKLQQKSFYIKKAIKKIDPSIKKKLFGYSINIPNPQQNNKQN